MDGWATGLLWVFTLGIGGIIYTQWNINKVWRTQPPAFGPVPGQAAIPPADGDLERLQKLAALKDSGAITDDEYAAQKAKVLPAEVETPPSD